MANLNLLKFDEDLKLKVKAVTATWHNKVNYKYLVTFFFQLIVKDPDRFRSEYIQWVTERIKAA